MNNLTPPENLRCEYAVNPIGVYSQQPVFSWNAKSTKRGSSQSAYRIVAASSTQNLEQENYDKWDSGIVKSSKSCFIKYIGTVLQSAERVYWKVKLWDEQCIASDWSLPAFFEMGLLSRSEWKGRWISFLGGMHGNGILLRKEFILKGKPKKARAYICGIGYYELRLNGEKIGDKLLDPGATDYSKTLLCSIYDVTTQLIPGKNVVGIILGNGWAGAPKALLQLNIDYEDGTREEITTDFGKGWDVAKGPILYNSIYDGEDYDAREEKDGWDTPAYDIESVWQRPGGWILATVVEDPGGELVPEILPPIRVTQTIKPKLHHLLPDGSKIFDVGINLTGYLNIKVQGEAGLKVTMKFAEVLTINGHLDMTNLRLARCQDSYILKGKPEGEEYTPRFTYHGFRFVHIKTEGEVEVKDFTVHFVRSDLSKNAMFECSDPFLNQLEQVMWHTEACNMFSVPTDCCQRDERHGWTQDAVTRIEGSTYHFDVASFYEKWLRDIFDTQDEKGYVADTAPHRWGNRPCDPTVNVPISLPLLLYRYYGNKRVLEKYYSNMQKFIEALHEESENLIISRYGYGEWACPASECVEEPNGPGASPKFISSALVSTAYFYLDVKQIEIISRILEKDREVNYYNDLAEKIKSAYNKKFFNENSGQYDQGTQSANTISLAYGLVPDGFESKVLDNIKSDIIKRDYHLSTGSQGTKLIFEVLSQNGLEEVACAVMQQKTTPSFGYMLENGATSMWERWEADRNNNIMNSRNHPMFASCCTWFYKCLGGIQPVFGANGFDQILISPTIPQQLTFTKVELTTMSGTIVSSWKKNENGLDMDITIPFNATATVNIPFKMLESKNHNLFENGMLVDGSSKREGFYRFNKHENFYEIEIGSGAYHFLVK